MRDFEKKLILAALKENNSLSAAARALSITRQNLRYKLEKHGINTEEILGSEKR
ncbi:MAG: helix-turn-helix domain-containing protein [Anaerovoracaceae bacterium]